jgi:hypothetical protein
MNQHSMSNISHERARPWLEQHYQATRERTVNLVKDAVDQLVKDKQPVTIEAIQKLSQQLDPQEKGVKKAGILGNAEAYAYYQQHRTSRAVTRRRSSPKVGSTHRLPADPSRDLGAVRRRYLRERKPDLVERLLFVEQAYIESQQQLARLQFELLDQQQKTQKRRENTSF